MFIMEIKVDDAVVYKKAKYSPNLFGWSRDKGLFELKEGYCCVVEKIGSDSFSLKNNNRRYPLNLLGKRFILIREGRFLRLLKQLQK